MKRFYLLIAFDAIMAIVMGVTVMRGGWRFAPFLFVLTLAMNLGVIRPGSRGTAAVDGKARRSIVGLAYALIFVAVMNSLILVKGWSWAGASGVLGPFVISGLLFRFAGRMKTP